MKSAGARSVRSVGEKLEVKTLKSFCCMHGIVRSRVVVMEEFLYRSASPLVPDVLLQATQGLDVAFAIHGHIFTQELSLQRS